MSVLNFKFDVQIYAWKKASRMNRRVEWNACAVARLFCPARHNRFVECMYCSVSLSFKQWARSSISGPTLMHTESIIRPALFVQMFDYTSRLHPTSIKSIIALPRRFRNYTIQLLLLPLVHRITGITFDFPMFKHSHACTQSPVHTIYIFLRSLSIIDWISSSLTSI